MNLSTLWFTRLCIIFHLITQSLFPSLQGADSAQPQRPLSSNKFTHHPALSWLKAFAYVISSTDLPSLSPPYKLRQAPSYQRLKCHLHGDFLAINIGDLGYSVSQHLVTTLFQQIVLKHLLFIRHCSRFWREKSEYFSDGV